MPTFNTEILYPHLQFEDWGLIDYTQALEKQLELVQQVSEKNLPGYLVFCTHPPVVTTGRATRADDIFDWKGNIIEVSRGGRATYHGPSQIVIYPIINLKFPRHGRQEMEVVGFLRDFEKAIVETLTEFKIVSQGKSLKKPESDADETGVWSGNKKIASLGIAVKKWVTYHGAAINFSKDESAFKGINPCGFTSSTMVSVEELTTSFPKREDFKSALHGHLIKAL